MPGLTDRVCCSVPGCRRTRKPGPYSEWVCADHWRAVPQIDRRTYSQLRRKGWDETAAEQWDRCKGLAIEAASGI